MAMNSFAIHHLLTLLHLLLHFSHSQLLPNPPPGWEFLDKSRLGSRPPGCHNRCNMCHPCMAVQVPTTPIRSDSDGSRRSRPFLLSDDSAPTSPAAAAAATTTSEYTNYKPLGWKCHCRDRYYDP